MLWYKAWLETRWRFVFLIGSVLFVWLLPLLLPSFGLRLPPGVPASRMWLANQLGSVLLSLFTAIFLAGAGINTQTTYTFTSGFHGSMLFTLSLPVSRGRLFFVRSGLGAIQTSALVVVMAGYTLVEGPGPLSASEAFTYLARAVVCTLAIYGLSVFLLCFLDEMWEFMGACLLLSTLYLLQSRLAVVAQFSPLRGLSLISYPLTAPMPWAPVLTSVAMAGVLFYASVLILQRKEF